ncbi:signal transduction histidine kinase/ligand-binding sensor domain-containing protein/DNA-binding response OmpR family regulator [Parabacteroides sp. PF5-5]|uniref:hybrid sensor histidine kinase/response regulator transcription factor n=1 Tax=unclassified Parabacteroides TaxID=2649774 RepID=UPI002476374E|nr:MULTISPECIES: two-component regulator propeller domain-containing protein [unclassified Parabacteroides]MDH6304672.1 signal transduction histidine kinase/ligand-binding sensor domain-containing protein/DNA-binding response OmpR family regulator [Parabacteroides sp. PH5-39]MDH6315714.1 signal transduction histidine kinase/ligand-binding sensor domain-containing protein/DNA-binding response OmpR family regulator [Parabacteroides sp. PF5-13]MDH6319374.1 signal transduction histidine kinase/ligan
MRKEFIIVFLCICISLLGHAQSVKLFSVDKELSNSLIYNIYQDKNGIIWIATEDGLNRYDGSKFTIYKHDKNDTLSLGHNFVRILFEDSKEHFFVGLFKGLQLYDYATDTFNDIPMILENGEIAKSHVTSIIERKNGDIIIGTSGEGLYQLTQEDGKLYAKQESWIVPSLHIICVYEDKAENLWVSTEDKGLYLLTKNNNLISFFRHNNIVLHNISSICEDKDGNLLVGSMTRGLFGFNKNAMSFFPIEYPENPNLPIKKLYTDGSNDIYIGTDGCGIKVYDSDSKKIIDNSFNVTIFDLEKSKAHTMIKDNAGNIWLGIYQKGVIMVPVQTNKFSYIGYKSMKYNKIGSNCIMSVYEDSEGILWVGTDNDGLYGLHPDGRSVHFAHSSKETSIPPTILCIFEDSNKNLWLGSYLNGMAKVNKRTGECTYVTNLLDQNQNPVQRVYAFQEDANKQLWIGTMGFGLYCMDLNTGEITNHNRINTPELSGEENYLFNNWIDCLLLTKEQKLYIGTYNGLICLDLKTKSYLSTFDTLVLFPGLVIYTLYEDKQGNLYAGTSEGLICIDKNTNQTSIYTTEDGLPNNVVCGIKRDGNNNLWISTNYGMSQFNLINKTFVNYYASDGLQGNEFSKSASLINFKGQFIFGGISGITFFNPQDICFQEKKLQIHITDFYIHDKPVRKNTKSGSYTIIDTSVMSAENFNLSHSDNSFSIEFSTMEFNTPERISYMYSINGENWVTLLPGVNRISFSNLAPGKYNFKVKARDYDSYSDERNISVTIHPPWYLTAWAKLVYLLIALLLIYLSILETRQRYRSRQKMVEHQHAEEINEAKLQFFMNIAHEIRTPMSLVISPLKRLMTSDKNNERQASYKIIHRNAERILSLINQLMDIRKIDKGIMTLTFQEVEIVGFVGDLYSYFEYQAKAKNIDFNLRTELKQLKVWVDPKNFDKIILNVLSNAFKFTPENGKIDIYLSIIDEKTVYNNIEQYFEIIISDNGIGINDEEKERVFERFYQIRNSHNSSNVSTGIGLHLTRSLVELHHGSIWMENNEEGGSSFIIRIPMGKDHLKPEEIEDSPEQTAVPAEKIEISSDLPTDTDKVKVKSKTKHRIMIVEDDEEIRKYICEELAGEYHTVEYANGKEALSAILKKAPDLVISDVMMPEMDGITLCRKIKQNININHIPVVLVTAKSREEDNLEGLSIGADAYIVKPFNIDLLKKTIENIIRNRELLRNTYEGNQLQEDKVKKIQIKSADEKLMERIMKVINNNLSNPELSVESIADQVGISRVHLHRKLKELTNQTTRDFIRNIRLKQAADLLAGKNLSISEVAEATGFTNLGHFSNAFKELYGVPPSTYMEEHRNNS